MTRVLEILYNEGSDAIVLGDPESGDDIAEVFHHKRHTVNQTVEQALETARLFAAAPAMLQALRDIEAAGPGGYLTPELCGDIVMDAIARVTAS